MELWQACLEMAWKYPALGLSALWAPHATAQGQRPSVVGTILTNQTELASVTGVYNTSQTPADLPWDTYNYCNAPHVNAAHYTTPNVSGAKLMYLNTVMRHHKRTPDNLYPKENVLNTPWDCTDFQQFNFVGPGAAQVFHETNVPPWHPFLSTIWNGTCDEGQLTRGGLEDAVKHGQDFWSVYSKKLGFLHSVNEKDIFMRTSVETRTMQVASGLLVGFDKSMATKSFPVTTQPSPIDSIPPNYPCNKAGNIRNAFQSVPAWTNHLQENMGLKMRLDAMLGTAGLSDWAVWYDHFFDTFTSRTCNGHPLPCNTTTGQCVTNQDARTVFSIGDFEYNYIWSNADNASTYNQLTAGIFLQELAQNMELFRSGGETFKLRFYVGHDGTMIRLISALGLGETTQLRWPSLGSELVMEVWDVHGSNFVRVIHDGVVFPALAWTPLDQFIDLINSQVPDDIFAQCNSS